MLPVSLLLAFLVQSAPAPQPSLATVIGVGVQIYTCGADGRWTFTAPEATLYQDKSEIGKHDAGPRWTWSDGSAVTGKLVTSTPASEPSKNIPSLELTATPVPGTSGFLSAATRITRTETQGGVAPAEGCDGRLRGEIIRVPYAATYTFFKQ